MKTTILGLLLAVILSACAPAASPAPTASPTQDLRAVAAHQVLTHSSGVPHTTRWEQPGDKMVSSGEKHSYEPGTTFSYADVDYDLRGKFIETVSGQSYEAFVQKNIFELLQMSNTGYDHPQADLAEGYASAQAEIEMPSLTDYNAVGSLYSTVEDLYRWDQALYTEKLVPQPSLSAMFTSQIAVPDGQYYGQYGKKGWGRGYG